ncbi:Threonylcarbamoyl-AMP synthase [Buchnera aphidicola (Cavariella theobaldi)]
MHQKNDLNSLVYCVEMLKKNNVIAYPTESMFGLGCDPTSPKAVYKLLHLKKRKIEKGLILVASNYSQIKRYINELALSSQQKKMMFFFWPGPFTFLVPANFSAPYWLTGKFNTVAVRISAHSSIVQLCNMFGKAIISTSANISNMPPCLSEKSVFKEFGQDFPLYNGKIGHEKKPSTIIDVINGQFIRNA